MTVHLKLPKINAMRYLKPPKTYLCLVLPLLLSILEVLRRHHRDEPPEGSPVNPSAGPKLKLKEPKFAVDRKSSLQPSNPLISSTLSLPEEVPHMKLLPVELGSFAGS